MSTPFQSQGDALDSHNGPPPGKADVIPLVCYICPKNAHFSDLSHLLTHISSKGHLHNMFQLTLSRDVDDSAKLALTEYDNWFNKNGIGPLLRARKTAREQKDSREKRQQTPAGLRGGALTTHSRSGRGGRANFRSRGNGRTMNRHNHTFVKSESSHGDDDELQRGLEYHNVPETAYSWNHDVFYLGESTQYPNHIGGQFHDYMDDDDDSTRYDASELYSPFPVEGTPDTIEDDTSALILKGVVYPGMAGFDSATEKDRRMRNQKKDPAVLMKLETNSQLVTRSEEVLDTNLSYQRTRDVYDDPSVDGSTVSMQVSPFILPVVIIEARTKRRTTQAKSYTSAKRRSNAGSRTQSRGTKRGRGSRSARGLGRPALHTPTQQALPVRRVTRSANHHHDQQPLHGHGAYETGTVQHLEDGMDEDDGGQNSNNLVSVPMFTHQMVDKEYGDSSEFNWHNRVADLALRPGNPNAAFGTPTLGYRKSPSRFPSKENGNLLLKSPASSFNPYLHPQNDSMEPGNYNPLCQPPPRDGFGFRLYSTYDEEPTKTSQSFAPINNTAYDQVHMTGMPSGSYLGGQPTGDEYTL
ncbi:hypothetical protein GGS20DRAFT_599558 [Poronia punctata]|nr:hypothetical protein GGS20DRAFT_599558 [Poronia punctata]